MAFFGLDQSQDRRGNSNPQFRKRSFKSFPSQEQKVPNQVQVIPNKSQVKPKSRLNITKPILWLRQTNQSRGQEQQVPRKKHRLNNKYWMEPPCCNPLVCGLPSLSLEFGITAFVFFFFFVIGQS